MRPQATGVSDTGSDGKRSPRHLARLVKRAFKDLISPCDRAPSILRSMMTTPPANEIRLVESNGQHFVSVVMDGHE